MTLATACGFSAFAPTAQAQVTIHPRSTTPASWQRFAIRVVAGTDTATTGVRGVPNAVTMLGRTQLSIRGVTALAGMALGVSLIALILAIARGRAGETG